MIRRFRCMRCGWKTEPKDEERFRSQSVCPECGGRKWKACPPLRNFRKVCAASGCRSKVVSGGYCARHYQVWLRHCADDAETPHRLLCTGCGYLTENMTGLSFPYEEPCPFCGGTDWKCRREALYEKCSVDGCDETPTARGLCGRHYQQWRKSHRNEERQ